MFADIHWHAYLRAKRAEKVERHLRQFEKQLGCPVTLVSSKRYWKDTALFDVVFTTPLGAPDIASAVLQTLLICQRLFREWTVSGPWDYEDGKWEFRARTANFVEGVELVSIEVRNFEPEVWDEADDARAS